MGQNLHVTNRGNFTDVFSATSKCRLLQLLVLPCLLFFGANAQAQTTTFNYTGTVQAYTVATTGTLVIDMAGAKGGNTYGFSGQTGGYGGRVVCTLAVTAGQVLDIYVGGEGITQTSWGDAAGGFNGGGLGTRYNYYYYYSYVAGGGGGASDIRIGGTALANRVIVAGGGGGAGLNCGGSEHEAGGGGGGLTGESGYQCGNAYTGGGTQSAGGDGAGSSGSLGNGGAGVSDNLGGGGGGGYYGGGGGYYSGGGGGSSYTHPSLVTGVTHTQGYQPGNGYVSITPVCTPPAVSAITGNTTLSTVITTKLSNATSGGVWSSSNTSVGTVNSTTGLVTGLSAGTSTISYTVTESGCNATVTTNVAVKTPNNAILFDGSNDRIDGTNSLLPQGSSARTIEAWVKVSSASGHQAIFNWGTFSSNLRTGLLLSNDHLYYVGEGNDFDATSATLPLNTWTHVAATLSGQSVKIYVNGVLMQSGTLPSVPNTTGTEWSISNTNAHTPTREPFVGSIDEVRVWNTVRTASEIAANMNCDVAQQTGLVAYYRFDQGVASGSNTALTTVFDYSGNGNCGTISNMALTGSSSNYVTGAVGSCNSIALVQPITGSTSACIGSSATLADVTSGGTWSSSNASIASVNSSGVVAAVAAGTVTISYTVACGGTVTTIFTVNAYPSVSAITGNTTLSTAIPTTLNDVTGGGVWSSANTSIATIGSTNGKVSGIAEGTATISYTVTTGGCATTVTTNVTVLAPRAGLHFDGANDFISFSNNLSSVTNFTYEAWVYETSNAGWSRILDFGNYAGYNMFLTPTHGGTTFPRFAINIGAGEQILTSSTALPLNTWTHIAVTLGGSTAKMYLNGVLTATNTSFSYTPSSLGATVNNWIGRSQYADPYFQGKLDDIRIWNVTRTQSEIQANMNCDLSQQTGLIAYYRFNNGTIDGTNTANAAAVDYSSNNKCGVLNNFALSGTTSNYVTGAVGACNSITITGTTSGTLTVCEGATTMLGNTLAGGTWSSGNMSVATVSGSGVVSGVSAGTANISYSINCIPVVVTVTVNATPSITGASNVCANYSTSLSASVSGGTWSSTNTSAATIDATTGVVNGIAAGNTVISYVLPTACYGSHSFTVNPLPASIAGASAVCEGFTISLSNTTSGGSWSSSDESVATIASSGIVSGILAGTATITYTLPTGCYITKVITVNAQPSAITGSTPMCTIATLTLENSLSGGVWSSANTSIASINATTGVVIATGEGITNVTYTMPTGCFVTTTVNSLVAPITVNSGICRGTTGAFGDVTSGGTWSSSDTSIITVVDSTGSAYGVAAGSATVTYMLGSGCYRVMDIVIDSVPAPIVGPSTICVGSTYTLTDASPGGTWSSVTTGYIAGPGSTGQITGLSAGSQTFTYTLSPICKTYFTVTANSVPTGILGTKKACQGQTTTLSDATTGGTWSSVNPSVATINSSGVVTGVSGGTAMISYTLATGCAATAIVTINPTPNAITGTTTVCAGTTSSLSSTSTPAASWVSSAPSIASVNSGTGVFTGVSAGTATITYTIGTGCYTTTVVSVTPIPATITGASTVCSSASTTLTNTDAGGTWSSSNASTATVGSATGVVTGVAAGNATITYSLYGCRKTKNITVNPTPTATSSAVMCKGATATVSVSVTGGVWSTTDSTIAYITPPHVNGIGAGNATISYVMGTGCFTTIPVTVNPSPAAITGIANIGVGATTTLANAVSGGVWSSSNTAVATIGTTGIVNGLSAGTTSISYTLAAGCYITKTLTVGAIPAITGNLSTCAGSTSALSNGATGGTWSSSNTTVATIGSSNGVVSALVAGTSTITYTTPLGGYQVATFTVLATPAAITSSSFSLCSSASTTLNHAVSGGTWSSSNAGVASVGSATGIVTAGSGAGTANITYTLSAGCTATAVVSVTQLPTAISGTASTHVGYTTTLTNGYSGGVWASGSTSIATISGSGVVTGVATGTSEITYAIGACSRNVIVTVNPAPDPITGPATLCVGSTTTLSNATSGGTWSQAPATGSNVSGPGSTGAITGVSAGTATITYTLPSGIKTYFVVTVIPTPAVITGGLSVCQSATATVNTLTTGGAWSSSNSAIASINATTGVVSGIAAGTATISYTGTNGCFRTAIETVNPSPAAISGTAVITVGTTTTLSSTTGTSVSWSSSTPSVATVNATTGVVTGLAVGTSTITYTIGSGCSATRVVTVNASTALGAISGPSTVCIGASVTFTNATSGGAWTSANGLIATVDGTTGVVTGVAAGSTRITYTVGAAFVTKIITVNALPAASGGYKIACVGLTTQLTNASGGVWSSSDTFIAKTTVGGTNAVITGVAPGTANITYTKTTTGCYDVTVVTVNPVPPAITGTQNVCVGLQTTLANTLAGGSWSSSNTAYANVGSANGIVTAGSYAGQATIHYSFGANCKVSLVVTVRQVPNVISGPTVRCIGSVTSYTSTTTGGTWSSSNTSAATIVGGSAATIASVQGIGAGVTVLSYSNAPSCTRTLTVTVAACRGANETTSVDEISNGVAMSLYPNPTTGSFTVSAHASGILSVYTMEGKEVAKQEIAKGETQITLPNELAKGIYMCRFNGEDGSTVMVRLIVE